MEKDKDLFTAGSSEWDESQHPRDELGRFAVKGEGAQKKMTPAEKIASVHIAFDRDNILPELNEEDLVKVGATVNKPVLLKKSVIDRNAVMHSDLSDSDFSRIILNALYAPSEVFPANKEKAYFHFAKVFEIEGQENQEIGVALLDVDDRKTHFEIVHAHWVRQRSYETLKKK